MTNLDTKDDSGHIFLSLRMSPEAFESLERIAERTHVKLDDVVAKAFILYQEAAEASSQGKAVGIAPNPDVLETEFVGF
jgi:hypothetical protein